MKSSTTTFFSVCIILFLAYISQAKEWRGITPLHSTRKDVERLLGAPVGAGGIISDYRSENEVVSVQYTEGSCEKGWPYGWSVPPDTVLSLTVYPKVRPSLAALRIDLGKFEKEINPHIADIIYYHNKEEGFSVESRVDEEIAYSLSYTATEKDIRLLRCSDAAVGRADLDERISNLIKLYSYGDISFADEKEILNRFAKRLWAEPKSKGYIIAYSGQHTYANEAEVRLARTKNYLVRKCGVTATLLVTRNGGYRENSTIELYVVPLGIHPIRPTIRSSKVQTIKGRGRPTSLRH